MNENEEEKEFNSLADAEELHRYIQNNEINSIVELICKRSNSERQEIKETYKSTYGTELDKELDSKLSGKLKDLILGCLLTPVDFDATEINKSIKGAGTDEELLSETIATKPSRHLLQVKQRYSELFNETLEKAISGDTSGYYEKILTAVIQGKRSENPYPNSQKMKEIVEKLNGGENGKIQKDYFVQYFGPCSYGEICTICRLYEKTYKENILEVIKREIGGDTYEFFKMFLHYISDPGAFFAEKIHNFKDRDLIRILISRSEVNMDEIRDSYKELYKTDLIEDLKDKTKDEYQLGLTILAQK